MSTLKILLVTSLFSLSANVATGAEKPTDSRELIQLPDDIQMLMLANMRDHVAALDNIIHAVESGEYDRAQKIAEYRLGWSSLIRMGDKDIAEHWVKPMQKMADQMYRSASNFVIVSQNASVEESPGSYRDLLRSLGEVTAACRACHEAYRIR